MNAIRQALAPTTKFRLEGMQRISSADAMMDSLRRSRKRVLESVLMQWIVQTTLACLVLALTC
jgi:Fe-S-cluster formation regulator IscX/YfhJ